MIRRIWAVALVIVVGAAASMVLQGLQPKPRGSSNAASVRRPATDTAIATATIVRSGNVVDGLHYTVNAIAQQSSVQSFSGKTAASGEFLILNVSVRNLRSTAADVSALDFHLERGDRQFGAAIGVSVAGAFLRRTLSRGMSASGALVFDVPPNTSPAAYRLVLSDNQSESTSDEDGDSD